MMGLRLAEGVDAAAFIARTGQALDHAVDPPGWRGWSTSASSWPMPPGCG